MITLLLFVPLIGAFFISLAILYTSNIDTAYISLCKYIALITSMCTYFVSFVIFTLFDFSDNQFLLEQYELGICDVYLEINALSIRYISFTTMMVAGLLLLTWTSLTHDTKLKTYLLIVLLLETLIITLLLIDDSLFYTIYAVILPPICIMIGPSNIGPFEISNEIKVYCCWFTYALLVFWSISSSSIDQMHLSAGTISLSNYVQKCISGYLGLLLQFGALYVYIEKYEKASSIILYYIVYPLCAAIILNLLRGIIVIDVIIT